MASKIVNARKQLVMNRRLAEKLERDKKKTKP
jgi:hypothetical protein